MRRFGSFVGMRVDIHRFADIRCDKREKGLLNSQVANVHAQCVDAWCLCGWFSSGDL